MGIAATAQLNRSKKFHNNNNNDDGDDQHQNQH